MKNRMHRQSLLMVYLGLLHWYAASQEDRTFGACTLTMSGECPYSAEHTSNQTKGVGKMQYIPVDISIGGHPAPSVYIPTNYTPRGSIRASHKVNSNVVKSHWGEDQTVGDETIASQVRKLIDETDAYMRHEVFKRKEYRKIRKHCLNQHGSCSQWALQGECRSNPLFMQLQCAPACQTCEMLDVQRRCPIDETQKNAWEPGDLNRMFERITTDPYYAENFGPIEILSRPNENRKERTRRAGHNIRAHEDGPWLVSMDR